MQRDYRTDEDRRAASFDRREMLRAANKCINGPLYGTRGMRGKEHGPVVQAGRCQCCLDTKRRTA